MVNGKLPDGWEWKTVDEVTLPIEKVDPKQEPKKEFTYLDIASIDNSIHKITEPKSYYGTDAPSRARQLVQANDILFSTVRTYLEKIAQVPEIYDGQIASTGFSVLRANESVLPKYLFYYSLSQNFLEPLNDLQRGTSYPAVRDNDVRIQKIPIAPLPEQERIVDRIEELFTQLEAGTSALAKVQAGLRRYKASVLKAAVEGKLVGNIGVENSGELPKGWRWVKVEDLAADERYSLAIGPFGSNLKVVDYQDQGVPLVFVRHIRTASFDETHYVTKEKAEELRAHQIAGGDVLITKMGEPPGDACLYPETKPMAVITADCIKWRVAENLADKKFILHVINSPVMQKQIQKITRGVAQKKVSLDRFRILSVPLPPLEEQRRIVAEVERRLSVARQVENTVEATLARASRLRQAVLRSAFEGRL